MKRHVARSITCLGPLGFNYFSLCTADAFPSLLL